MSLSSGVTSPFAPKVTILMLTYNHERYIAQAIESVLQQKTNFAYELLIADDHSTDRTPEIVASFQKNSLHISYYRSEKNNGMYHNLAQIFYHATGEYIAFLEGDDYWIAQEKLQKQVDFLETNPNTSLCFHQVRLVQDGQFTGSVFPEISKRKLTLEELFKENFIPTCSAVFRRNALPSIPSWCADLKMLDWPLFMLLAKSGEITFLPEQLSAYRIHPAGAWSQLTQQRKSEHLIQVLRTVKQYVGKKHRVRIDHRISKLYDHITWCCEERNATAEALAASWNAAVAAPFWNFRAVLRFLRLSLKHCRYYRLKNLARSTAIGEGVEILAGVPTIL